MNNNISLSIASGRFGSSQNEIEEGATTNLVFENKKDEEKFYMVNYAHNSNNLDKIDEVPLKKSKTKVTKKKSKVRSGSHKRNKTPDFKF